MNRRLVKRRREDRNPLTLLMHGDQLPEPGSLRDELNQLIADAYIVRLRYLTAECGEAILLRRVRQLREAWLTVAAELEPCSLAQQTEERELPPWAIMRLTGVPR